MPYINYDKGDKVTVKPTPSGVRESGPAANWLTHPMEVELLEDAISGTWDVFDVRLPDGTEESIYGFNIDDGGDMPEELLDDVGEEKLAQVRASLIKIADSLDHKGMTEQAGVLDDILKRIS